MEQETCLGLNENSFHYKLTKYVWGKRWDQQRDYDKYFNDDNNWQMLKHQIVNDAREKGEEPNFDSLGQEPHIMNYWKDKRISLCPYARRVLFGALLLPAKVTFDLIAKIPFPDRILPQYELPQVSISYKTQDKIVKIIKAGLLAFALVGVGYIAIYEPMLALILGLIAAGIGGAIGVGWLLYKLWCATDDFRDNHPLPKINLPRRAPREPSGFMKGLREFIHLATTYIHARHKNICPCLERVKN